MNKSTQTITVLGVDFEVNFSYVRNSDKYYDIPEPDIAEIEEILLDGWIVNDVLSDWTLNEIRKSIDVPSKYEEDQGYAEYIRDMQRENLNF